MIWTTEGLADLLAFGSVLGATGDDPKLLAAKVALIVNNVNPTAQTLWADIDEASWTGYLRSAVVAWELPALSSETLLPALFGDLKTFLCTAQADPLQTVYGYALVATITAVDHLLAVLLLPVPIQPIADSSIGIIPRASLAALAITPSGDLAFA